MKLSQKIKHIKRHRQNKKLYDSVEVIYHLGVKMEMPLSWQNMLTMYVSPLMYEVMKVNHGHIPTNITCSPIIKEKDRVITSTREWYDIFHKEPDEKTKEELSSLPFSQFTNPELYMGADLGLRASVSAPVLDSVIVKEV